MWLCELVTATLPQKVAHDLGHVKGGSSAVQNYACFTSMMDFFTTKKLAIKDIISVTSPKISSKSARLRDI
jgi:hypothetical protein